MRTDTIATVPVAPANEPEIPPPPITGCTDAPSSTFRMRLLNNVAI